MNQTVKKTRDDEIRAFLNSKSDENQSSNKKATVEDFISGKAEPSVDIATQPDELDGGNPALNIPPPRKSEMGSDGIYKDISNAVGGVIGDWGVGATDALLNTLDVPNDIYNWAAEKLDADYRLPSTRSIGADLHIGTREGEEPDAASYMAGEWTVYGLEFLMPVLRAGKSAVAAIPGRVPKSTTTGVAEKMSATFQNAPKSSFMGELTASNLGAVASHELGERYGWKGEQAGAVIGGLSPQVAGQAGKGLLTAFSKIPYTPTSIAKSLYAKAQAKMFPFTAPGARAKSGEIIRSLKENKATTVADDINLNKADVLPEAIATKGSDFGGSKGRRGLTPARLTGDEDLMALEKLMIKEDPELAREFKIIEQELNDLAKKELFAMKGNAAVQDAQDFIKGKYAKLNVRLNAYLDKKILDAQDAINGLAPREQRIIANSMVKAAIDKALTAARHDEDKIWSRVDKSVRTMMKPIRDVFQETLQARWRTEDPAEIPSYLYKFIGKYDDTGVWTNGSLEGRVPVGEVHALRSRLLIYIRLEGAKGSEADFNKIRVMGDMQEAMLLTLLGSKERGKFKNAINFSAALNERFRGGYMKTIMNSDKSGGMLAPEMTMENAGLGIKGYVNIKKVLKAAPESAENIEQVIRADMLTKLVNKNTGRIGNLRTAKNYADNNAEMIGLFPETKLKLDRAIALEEQAQYFANTVRGRTAKAQRAAAFRIANTTPKRVLTTILEEKDPVKAMTKTLKRLNKKGRVGIKNDVIDLLYAKGKTSKKSTIGYKISGEKMSAYWTENMDTLSKPFSSGEIKRLNQIMRTLELSEIKKGLPTNRAEAAIKPSHGIAEYIARLWIVERVGGMSGTMGGSMQRAQMASNKTKELMGNLDIGRAKRMLSDSVFDEDLYKALAADFTAPDFKKTKHWRVIQGWMMANTIETIDGTLSNEIEQ